MKITDKTIQRKKVEGETKSIPMSIRITPSMSKWLKENNLSPTGIFYQSLVELGYKKPTKSDIAKEK